MAEGLVKPNFAQSPLSFNVSRILFLIVAAIVGFLNRRICVRAGFALWIGAALISVVTIATDCDAYRGQFGWLAVVSVALLHCFLIFLPVFAGILGGAAVGALACQFKPAAAQQSPTPASAVTRKSDYCVPCHFTYFPGMNMKTVFHFALMLAIVVVPVFQNRAEEDGKTELEGTWELISLERDGKDIKPQKDTKAVFTGDKFAIQVADKEIAAGTFKIDATQKPKATDATYTKGPDKGKSFKGIYQIDGDTLKFCRAGSPDQKRPTEFKTKAGTNGVASIYKRVKP